MSVDDEDTPAAGVCVDPVECSVPGLPFEEKCPKCGGELYEGFGLAFGGMGPYQCCMQCDTDAKAAKAEYEKILRETLGEA